MLKVTYQSIFFLVTFTSYPFPANTLKVVKIKSQIPYLLLHGKNFREKRYPLMARVKLGLDIVTLKDVGFFIVLILGY